MSDKIYINGIYVKEIETKYGSLIKLSFKVDKFIEELKEHEKKGYVNVLVNKRREKDKYGNTHYATLDTYEKKEEDNYTVENPEIKDELPPF
jgi:hypothetical protein